MNESDRISVLEELRIKYGEETEAIHSMADKTAELCARYLGGEG